MLSCSLSASGDVTSGAGWIIEKDHNSLRREYRSNFAETIGIFVDELVASNVDIIIATGNELSPKAALAATKVLPIVMIATNPLALDRRSGGPKYRITRSG